MLSNFQLERLCRDYKIPIVDICMKNELPNNVSNGSYIINLQSNDQGDGTHWTCLHICDNHALFFDSFGAPPSVEIMDFVKQRPQCKLGYNQGIIQDLKSDLCGYFCVGLLLQLHLTKSRDMYKIANEYINQFDDNTKNNDEILKHYFKQLIYVPSLIKRILKKKI